ncbi:E3 ubiquitin-protein ligase RBBP6-like isoform X4 [Genypterus blacodes]|uniref:E3 ubiquitin-protein ligase RBBP6-like isoform X4 n=1 Tax=Genypterus blacodes TaxID=154954 RepID=UPI003F75768C
MSCVHYKFSSKLDYNTVTFDGMHITLNELKRQIMARERLKATECDLQITNAQTREEYTDDEVHIPKHSSVIVRRTPIGGVKPAGRTFIVDRSDTAVVGSSRPVCKQNKSTHFSFSHLTFSPPLSGFSHLSREHSVSNDQFVCIFCSLCVGYICVEISTSMLLNVFLGELPEVARLIVVCCFSLKTPFSVFNLKFVQSWLDEMRSERETTDPLINHCF